MNLIFFKEMCLNIHLLIESETLHLSYWDAWEEFLQNTIMIGFLKVNQIPCMQLEGQKWTRKD